MTNPTNTPARAATTGEKTKYRSNGQFVELGLAIRHPETVYSAQINQTFETLDGVVELAFNTATGDLEDVLPGMTVLIGSSAGARDKGICRVRKTPAAGVLYISETSDIQFADDDYIAVINEFRIWARDARISGDVLLMDYDIAFDADDEGGVIPRIGPLAAVVRLTGATVDFNPVDPSLSEAYDGATVVSYLFDAPGASATAGMDTAAPTFTYDTAGEYRWSCTITDSKGRETTAQRWLFVEPDEVDFVLEGRVTGDLDSGHWNFSVTLFEDAALDDIHDGTLVTLYERRAYYGGVAGSIGKIAGYESIKCTGWIDGESIHYEEQSGSVTFTVQGPGLWLDKIRAFPFELQNTGSTPTAWTQLEDMTTDKVLAHLLFWTSTAPLVMDCFFSGDETILPIVEAPYGTLRSLVNAIAMKIFAKALVNTYGQLYVEIDAQLLPSAARASLPVVMELTNEDWIGALDIERLPRSRVSMVELSAQPDSVTSPLVYSRAPGNAGKLHGEPVAYENYVAADQDECNRLAGCLLAMENNPYEPLEMKLAANNGLIDIAPAMYCTLSVAAGDTPRGITLSSARLIPRKVEFEYDPKGFLLTTVTLEFEAVGVDGVTYYPPVPQEENYNFDLDIPPLGDMDFPDGNYFPQLVPEELTTPCNNFVSNAFAINWTPLELIGSTSQRIAQAFFPCKLRGTPGFYSRLEVKGLFYADAPANYSVFGIKNGARIITASLDNFIATFTPLSDLEVDGFEIELASGMGSPIIYEAGEVIGGGTINATQPIGNGLTITGMTVGEYYAIDGAGGPWNGGSGAGQTFGFPSYFFALNQTGRVGYAGGTGTFWLAAPSSTISAVQISEFYGRVFVQKGAGNIGFGLGDPTPNNNSGTMSYILRKAYRIGRRIRFTTSTLRNVCAI